jgi:hypothetical protein
VKKGREKNVRKDLINHYRIPFNLENNNPKKEREKEEKKILDWNVDFSFEIF